MIKNEKSRQREQRERRETKELDAAVEDNASNLPADQRAKNGQPDK